MKIELMVNNNSASVDVSPRKRLSEVLRANLRLRSVRQNCKEGRCGCCLVLINRKPMLSCLYPVISARYKEILTIEGLQKHHDISLIERILKEDRIHFCPICAPSRTLSILSLLWNKTLPEEGDILETVRSVNCVCTNISQLKDSIHRILEVREQIDG